MSARFRTRDTIAMRARAEQLSSDFWLAMGQSRPDYGVTHVFHHKMAQSTQVAFNIHRFECKGMLLVYYLC